MRCKELNKEIIIKVPIDRFGKLPDKIDYSNIPYGRMEKAWRLLIRSIRSAIDNEKNYEEYSKLKNEYCKKQSVCYFLETKRNQLQRQLNALNTSAIKFGLKIEGCSVIKKEIEGKNERIKEIKAEMEIIKEKVPEYSWVNLYWW